jgi:hypothetical protein
MTTKPTEEIEDEIKDDFYQTLESTFDSLPLMTSGY